MFFVGGGSLLSQAVGSALEKGLNVELVCCPAEDSALPKLRKLGVDILQSDNPGADLLPAIQGNRCGTLFSINNKYILTDDLLGSGLDCFNIHNGLVQKYRGLAEVCIFASLCNSEPIYGVTLHRLLPNQKVDTGPIVAQLSFDIDLDADTFSSIMKRSLDACQAVFEQNIFNVIQRDYSCESFDPVGRAYSYKDVPAICAGAGLARLARASNLGAYRPFFPKLSRAISSWLEASAAG